MTDAAASAAITIRPATDADLQAMCALYNHYIENTPATFDVEPYSLEGYRKDWFSRYAPVGPHRALVAEAGGEILGLTYSSPYKPKAAYGITVESSVYCAPGQTGRGLGLRLYNALFQALQEEDMTQAVGLIALPNDPSEKLHQRCGFRRVGVLERVGRKFGREWDVAIWQRPLRAE